MRPRPRPRITFPQGTVEAFEPANFERVTSIRSQMEVDFWKHIQMPLKSGLAAEVRFLSFSVNRLQGPSDSVDVNNDIYNKNRPRFSQFCDFEFKSSPTRENFDFRLHRRLIYCLFCHVTIARFPNFAFHS